MDKLDYPCTIILKDEFNNFSSNFLNFLNPFSRVKNFQLQLQVFIEISGERAKQIEYLLESEELNLIKWAISGIRLLRQLGNIRKTSPSTAFPQFI